MSKKFRSKKPTQKKEQDELERLFSQFEEQLQACEEKIDMLQQSLSIFAAHKTEEDESGAS